MFVANVIFASRSTPNQTFIYNTMHETHGGKEAGFTQSPQEKFVLLSKGGADHPPSPTLPTAVAVFSHP